MTESIKEMTFENALNEAVGNIIFRSDQDDVWNVNKTKLMTHFFESNKDCKLLFTNGDLIDEKDISLQTTLWDKWGFDKNVRKSWIDHSNSFKDLLLNYN